MATDKATLRVKIQFALQEIATSDLRSSATALLSALGYASHKTLDLPADPQTFVREIEKLLGSTSPLNTAHANPADWTSAAFLFQLTNDELPALAAGQLGTLCITLAELWYADRDGPQGVFLRPIASLLARKTCSRMKPIMARGR